MITAKEARKLAKVPDEDIIKEQLEYAAKEITDAAKAKRRFVNLTSDFFVRGGYDLDPTYKVVVEKLTELGFKVKFFYEERQFVNMYTIVEW